MSSFNDERHPRDKFGKFRLAPALPPQANPIPTVKPEELETENTLTIMETNYLNHKQNQDSEPLPHLSLITTPEALEEAVQNKLITKTAHPEYPYSIYKYSQMCTYTAAWDETTLAARGLIIHDETGEIIARPFTKFFNYSENKTPLELMVGEIEVTEKKDGSLGIGYINPNGEMEISTAGGFQSDQAKHATELYNQRYKGEWEPNPNYTYMWEIIYPENRIVVDYGDEDDIHLLGAVNKHTGESIPVSQIDEWKWKKAEVYTNFDSLDKVVNAPERSNAEGYIVHFKESNIRIKFKHTEYLEIHKIATGLSEFTLHSLLAEGGHAKIEEYRSYAPEEFLNFIDTTVAKLEKQYTKEEKRIKKIYNDFVETLPSDIDQKGFALAVQKEIPKELNSYMFTLRAGKGLTSKKIWDSIKPEYTKSFWSANNGKLDEE